MRSKKVNFFAISVLVLVAGAIGVTVLKREGRDPESTGEALPTDSQLVLRASSLKDAERPVVPSAESASSGAEPAASNPFPNVPRSRSGMSLEDDPFAPQSVDEQNWLDRHGYPNARQWETYSQLSDGLLQVAADSGDLVAKTMLDARGLPDRAAVDKLLLSAANGDDFALQLLSARLAAVPGEGNLIDAYAVARVSEMRGNTSAAITRESMFSSSLTPEQRMRGEANAVLLNSTLNSLYEKKFGTKYPVDFRPVTIGKKEF